MDDRVPAADSTDGQPIDGEIVADVHRAPVAAELGGGVGVGIERRIGVGLDQGR